MQKVKKWAIMLLAAALSFALFACSSKEPGGDTASDTMPTKIKRIPSRLHISLWRKQMHLGPAWKMEPWNTRIKWVYK